MIDIDWSSFTPWTALSGGVLIGVAAATLVLLNGRIAGISGILGGLFTPHKKDTLWRLAFILGIVVTPFIWSGFGELPAIRIDAGYPALIAAGLLVGIGTRYGSGCTSGHGVCGLSRFSARSLVATLTFMIVGFMTVYIIRHLSGV
ncbi:YeeE/YedE family protein [Marinobacter sp. X15-166B]|uniref:YeeE/YedE family protein n=1 Tax=Marinobacter sp. X15-166B TaxID=1897620 RepID=UPI00085CD0B8|nr:YeeE/YedE family protein [Marinobacter sp. X15-166B]OEY67641.1 YeeE/YedE [Marinobacter sp. X15-166B]